MNNSLNAGMSYGENCTDIPVLVIFAPTASGKTALAEKLFGKCSTSPFAGKAEIVSADSMQVYKYLDVGTAKPDKAFLENLPHHLIDICLPEHQFGTGEFVREADKVVKDIFARGKLPVLCGGTAFYIKNFLTGLPVTPEADEETRTLVENRMKTEGKEVLYAELEKLDPESASKIHINDEYRIKRALEICLSTGKPRSSFLLNNPNEFRKGYKFLVLSLERDRKELYERINQRVDIMFESGLLSEIESLRKMGYTGEEPGLSAIGYREFFTSETDIEKIRVSIKHDTKRYAKRQETFFKSFNFAESVNPEDYEKIQEKISHFFKEYNF